MPKHYFTLVLDHAFAGERHIAFEIGGGICGSSFPEYDFFHLDEDPVDTEGDAIKSPMRRKIIRQLAQQVRKLYIVNGNMHMLLEAVGKEFIEQYSNVQYFSSFAEFCQFATSNPTELEGCCCHH